MKRFIKIQNGLFGEYTKPEETIIHSIKPMGFYIFSYLLYESNGNNTINTSKGFISQYLDLDIRTVTKYLMLLKNNNLISCSQDIQKNKNTLLEISLKQYYDIPGGYELIPSELFEHHRKTISDKGWLLLCFITKLANFDLGSGIGLAYANVSREFIEKQIGIDKETITIYTGILEEQNLIEVKPRKSISLPEGDYCYTAKIYRIPFKVKANRKQTEQVPKIPT